MFQTDRLFAKIDYWMKCLDNYTIGQMVRVPAPGSWSMGQLYIHLIRDSTFYIEQARETFSGNKHSAEQSLPAAKEMFSKNEFPDIQIEGNPSNAFIPQPESKDQLLKGLVELKRMIKEIAPGLTDNQHQGKTKHPGLGYFSAPEWIQFTDMHFHHHLKQKKRIDTFLETIN